MQNTEHNLRNIEGNAEDEIIRYKIFIYTFVNIHSRQAPTTFFQVLNTEICNGLNFKRKYLQNEPKQDEFCTTN